MVLGGGKEGGGWGVARDGRVSGWWGPGEGGARPQAEPWCG